MLAPGWLESTHINTIEPAPVGEASRDGDLALDFGHVAAGDSITVYLQFQVNPNNLGRRSQDVRLYDDTELLATAQRPDVTVRSGPEPLMDIVVRAFFAFFVFVFLLTRLIGRRELSSLEPFDLILLVVVGDLMQQGITQSDMSYTGAVLATGTFAVMVLAVSYFGFRFRRLRAAPRSAAADRRPGRRGDRGEPPQGADDRRRAVGRGAPSADRLARGGQVGACSSRTARSASSRRADVALYLTESRGRRAALAARRARGDRGLLHRLAARRRREPAADADRARGRRLRADGRGRPGARARGHQDVRVAPRRHAVRRRALRPRAAPSSRP